MVRTIKSHIHCLVVCDVVDIREIIVFLSQDIASSVKDQVDGVVWTSGKINNLSKQVVIK